VGGKLACYMQDNQQVIAPVTTPAPSADVPQFSTAEYAHIPGTERCRICGNAIAGEYFRVNSQMACGKCAGEAREGQPTDSHAAFARGLLLGGAAGVLGLILYATVVIVTGWSIGYLALAVGWLVAKGIMKGSNGMGGRRYQVVAVLLTYASISLAAVPVWISLSMKQKDHPQAQTQRANEATDAAPAADDTAGTQSAAPKAKPTLVKVLVQLFFIGLASPFLELRDPASGALGLVILFVGLSIAFRMTAAKPLEVDGPYRVTA
jgi:hypothetical protein